jgi:predicted  nucleic acid-binding Zn-ribbon protein
MDSSRILTALQEQDKWRDRRVRLEERLRSVRAKKRFLQRELDDLRRKIAHLEGGVADPVDRTTRDVPLPSSERFR